MNARVLVVDDEVNILKTIGICLTDIGFEVALFSKPQEALQAIQTREFDLAFVDLKMSPIDGMAVMAEIRRVSPATTIVIITAHGTIDSAIQALKQGAYHYIQKPFDFPELQHVARTIWEHHQLTCEVRELRRLLDGQVDGEQILTRSALFREQLNLAAQVADSMITVLVEGESGTGKELIAQYIHTRGGRAQKPFVKVNCAALPEQLLESELFGHVKGAFTGAIKDRIGRFELAEGGTIFLDEIADMSIPIQAKLLRVLQSKEYEPLGDSHTRTVDVRVIAATNRNLDEALREGTFREDLFYRLNAVRIKLPPLRERPEDIPLLAEHFLRAYAQGRTVEISEPAMRAIRSYRWSGNVRELEHVLERAVLLASTGVIEPHHLPEEVRTALDQPVVTLSLEEIERRHILRVLQAAKDYDEAARTLGIDPATLWRKRRKYGL
jgi:two-component system, NtrC family, response regulator AlgB